jgi:uncharacterized protein (DUF1330 family)
MAVYVIVDIHVKDQAAFEGYKRGVPAMVNKHGGEYLARGGATQMLEGDWKPGRIVLPVPIRRVKAFLNDPEYQPLKVLRERRR